MRATVGAVATGHSHRDACSDLTCVYIEIAVWHFQMVKRVLTKFERHSIHFIIVIDLVNLLLIFNKIRIHSQHVINIHQ